MVVAQGKIGRFKRSGRMPRPAYDANLKTFAGRLAARLKDLREAAGITHEKAAEAITAAGYEVKGASTIYRWEQGTTQPHVTAFPAIATAYRVSIRQILPTG